MATGATAALADAAARTEWTISESLTVTEIHPGVWMHTSWQELAKDVRFPANGLIVRENDELILIDTAWGPEHTEALLDWIDAEIRLPVTLAIVSHFHDDSMGGAPVLEARGIRFISGPLTLALAAEQQMPQPDAIPGLTEGSAVRIGQLEVFYPGPAHSQDNLFVWLPAAEILFGGCAVRSPVFSGLGNTADGDLDRWPQSIVSVRDRYPNAGIVVPGHGPAGDASLLTHTIGLFGDPSE